MKPYEKLHQWLVESRLEAILVSKPENIGYLTNFWGSFGLYLQTKSGDRVLLSDGRYQESARALALEEDFLFALFSGEVPTELVNLVAENLAVEDALSLAQFSKFESWFEGSALKPQSLVVEQLRRVKSESELALMRAAQAHVDNLLLDFLRANLKSGVTERQLKFKLDQALRAEGKYDLSFESIVAFGPGSALPHYVSGDRALKSGDNILIDCGVIDRHYCSDMTRNFVYGTPSKKYQSDYAFLLQKQIKALSKLESGIEAKILDQHCRQSLGGLADYFIHSLGHGVGLEIHEAPTLSARSKDVLQENEVVTIEPGIYKPGEYGIRIEDAAIVQQHGSEVITHTTKDLLSFSEAGEVQTLYQKA